MELFEQILADLPQGQVKQVVVGMHWTAVVVENETGISCGLAVTQSNPEYSAVRMPSVRHAGQLQDFTSLELARLVYSPSWTERSVGVATINALLTKPVQGVRELNAEDYILEVAAGRKVAMVGHFPFVQNLRERLEQLWVLELKPQEGDLPAEAARDVIPQADLLAITGMTLINGTLPGLLQLCGPQTRVLLMGPTTLISPVLYDHGVHALSATLVLEYEKVINAVAQGATFRQIHKIGGVKLVTLQKEDFPFKGV